MAKPLKRDDDLTSRIDEDTLQKLYVDVEKGFEEQRERSDDNLDNWDSVNCRLGDKQFYAGNSKIFVPFTRDAVKARVTRFSNQVFPQSGRYVDVTTDEVDPPMATQALLEGYVRRSKLRTQVVPALLRNGDVEGQWTIYVTWNERTRYAAYKVQTQPTTDGMPNEAAEATDDIQEEDVVDAGPDVEVIADNDFVVLPVTADSIEEALEDGGSVTVLRRWSKGKIKQLIEDGEIEEGPGEQLIDEMTKVREQDKADTGKKLADAAGIKARGKVAWVYETWSLLKVPKEGRRLCRVYFGGEEKILGVKRNPFWNDRCPILSAPVEKVAGVFKGRPPVADVADLQIFANDTINEGADTAHFSAMPIVMTDPLANSRVDTMVLGLGAVWDADPTKTQIVQFPDLWRSAIDRALAIRDQIFQTLSVNPSMIPQQTGKPKRNQAEIANEQQVDILTTADVTTNFEESILTPLVQRFAELDHQFRDEPMNVRVYGEMGLKANMEMVEPIQLNKRFEFRWFGVEAARNAAQMQQQIAWVNVVKQLPPVPGYKLNLAPMIIQGTENVFGPRIAPLIFEKESPISVDPVTENEMLDHGFMVEVHPADDDMDHIQVHMSGMRMAGGDPHGTYREHITKHQAQMQAKVQQAMQQQQGAPGGGQGPKPGGQVAGPRQNKQPAGAIAQDQMGRAGATVPPRRN